MKYFIILFVALTICLNCNGQRFKCEIRGKKIYVKSEGSIVDSIGLYSPRYSEQLIQGSSIYYTDGIVTPDRVTIKIFKIELNEERNVRNATIKSLNLESEEFIGVKLSSEQVILRFRDKNGRKKAIYNISQLLK